MSQEPLRKLPEHSGSEEEHLITLAQQGDRHAFARLYRIHHGRVYALCLRLCGAPQPAEDACQEVFVRVWQRLPQFRFEAQFSSWLHRLTVNLALDQARKAHWWQRLLPLGQQPEPLTELGEPSPLDRLLPNLPTRPRQVFVLFAIEGYQHKEIAHLLRISEGASKAHYHRARQQLKELL
ncbi:RNA polymerase sigma factor [Ferrimonas gelatinilytica]|uniref:RNA polymerase sigma factor n=1 Tax=Ferrimonas gelatinilytica TaxID=1255257 RepID=UPI0031E84CC9